MNSSGWKQGKYEIKHPEKYMGDPTNIVYRSSWELDAFLFCDNNPNVLQWSSEEIAIPYAVPTTSGGIRPARYYPDLYMEYVTKSGKLCKDLIEIKPFKQTRPSRSRNPKTKMMENAVHAKNELKWEAARVWCHQRGITFRIINEKQQFK